MSIIEKIIDFILPPRCIITGEQVDRQGMISPQVWANLTFISDPQCHCCGYPFDFDSGVAREGNLCAGCLKSPPIFEKARAALVYNDASRDIILAFKNGDKTQAVPSFMPWLQQAGRDLLSKSNYLVPVPLHRWRLLRRRYNQSALIAQYLSKETNIPCMLDALRRVRATVTQGHLRADERTKNVKNAFSIQPNRMGQIKGKNILLIDDVFTTGSTVSECTKILLKSGANSVNVLSLARVVKPVRG